MPGTRHKSDFEWESDTEQKNAIALKAGLTIGSMFINIPKILAVQ